MPGVVAEHPALFLTLTAPSFGAVHCGGADGSCHLAGRRCRHGVALVCGRRHPEDDDVLGQALCADCYDYEGAVLWNATVSELWRRTTIYVLRELGHLAGMSVRETAKRLWLSYVKVVEFTMVGVTSEGRVFRVLSATGQRFLSGSVGVEIIGAGGGC